MFELSTAVVKVDIKVINARSSQSQCLQRVPPTLMHAEIPQLRDATELNNSDTTLSSGNDVAVLG